MRLLLDTQVVFLWMVHSDGLPERVAAAIADVRHHKAISAASFWELAIKQAKGKLDWPPEGFDLLQQSAFQKLAITPQHGLVAGQLPPHHSDPFDRVLVAQAQTEGMTLVGSDSVFSAYDVDRLWAD